ncbi:MAG: glycerophosphodiester phosphodiesterase [Pirellulaceae bacterium]
MVVNFRLFALSVLLLCVLLPWRVSGQDATDSVGRTKIEELTEANGATRPVVIAHRGASGYLPEHTLAAYAYAHVVGADFIEQDVVLTRDKVPIVLHDIHLEAVTNVRDVFPGRARDDGSFYALDFTLKEIKSLRVRERTKRDGKTNVYPSRFPQGSCDFRIPTLGEAIELVQGLNKSTRRMAGIYPEIKRPSWHQEQGFDISKIVVDLLRKSGYRDLSDRCIVQCFEVEETKRIRNELGCELKLVQLISGSGEALTNESLAEIAEFANGIGPALNLVVKNGTESDYSITSLTMQCHKLGLVVHPYTLRADELPGFATSFAELVQILAREAQVDGFFTDFPDQAMAVLKSGAGGD